MSAAHYAGYSFRLKTSFKIIVCVFFAAVRPGKTPRGRTGSYEFRARFLARHRQASLTVGPFFCKGCVMGLIELTKSACAAHELSLRCFEVDPQGLSSKHFSNYIVSKQDPQNRFKVIPMYH